MSALKSERLDILDESRPFSIERLLGRLANTKKILMIAEGLVKYFDLPTILKIWARMAVALKPFLQARYLTQFFPKLEQDPSYKYVNDCTSELG
jgi:O-methyltransferase involved in polyketide biosynthesis